MIPTEAPGGRHKGSGPTGLVILATIAATAALYLGREFFAPVVLALVLTALFRPVVGALGRIKVPAPVSATLIVLGGLALLGTGVFLLAQPVQDWVNHAPETFAAARSKLDQLRRPVQEVTKAVEKVQQEVTGNAKPDRAPAPAVFSQAPALIARVFGTTTALLSGGLQVLVIVFLLLATGDLFYRKVSAAMPGATQGARKETLEDAEAVVRHDPRADGGHQRRAGSMRGAGTVPHRLAQPIAVGADDLWV